LGTVLKIQILVVVAPKVEVEPVALQEEIVVRVPKELAMQAM
jgi:hypothetical protein